jgi:NitT/TauT family transport system permease protein
MADISYRQELDTERPALNAVNLRIVALATAVLLVAGIAASLLLAFQNQALDDPLLADSTLGRLAVWVTDQANRGDPQSILAQIALSRAEARGQDAVDEFGLLTLARDGLVAWTGLAGLLCVVSAGGLLLRAGWSRITMTAALVLLTGLIFIVPAIRGDNTLATMMLAITTLALALLFSLRRVSKVIGFLVILSLVLVAWEGAKLFAASVSYRVSVDVAGWEEYSAYPTVEEALAAVQAGDATVVLLDRADLDGLVAPVNAGDDDLAGMAYPDLRYTLNINREETRFGLPVIPALPGRLVAVTPADHAATRLAVGAFDRERLATVSEHAAEDFLREPRQLVLVNLRIFNNLNLPHLQSIAEALFQPARRNGPVLLLRILLEAGLYTWGEAALGFAFGATFGFLLGTTLAHSHLLQRGLLPYVVASQTVPILAIAPMVVIWLGAGPLAVAVIASYLTFFPVTINTLRGMQSPDPNSLDLMRSYAASPWHTLWKLRLPAALPYIFTALKISATASVVGAIIGELPSSVRNGLGRAILDFSSDYSIVSTPKLWAAIFIAALIGIAFFLIVVVVEFFVLRGRWQQVQ